MPAGYLSLKNPLPTTPHSICPQKGYPPRSGICTLPEDLRFEKLDILSQRGIGHINDCADLVLKNKGKKIDVHKVQEFKSDEKVNRRLYSGEAIGCFYVESPAMRGLLKKLQCNNYLSLVAASSIIRPGCGQIGHDEGIHQALPCTRKF
jgi:error-prone DNA polymerase